MKTVVVDRDFLELEIKPYAKLEEYRGLLAKEVKERLLSAGDLRSCSCPACQSGTSRPAFEKWGLTYQECVHCNSVYVSPRPGEEALTDFYRNSSASHFWREEILPETREARREKMFRPRAQWLLNAVDRYSPKARLGIAVGYHNELLIEELTRQESHLFPIIVTNPIADVEFAGKDLPGVTICPTPLSGLASLAPADILLAFDIVDRCADVEALFDAARATLAAGGLLLASTISISGFDLQVLWEHSKSIYPPERMNLLSIEGLTMLFERHRFEVLEFSTPGMFDVEAVQRAIGADPAIPCPRFVRYMMENRDENAMSDLQEYLQKHRLSSFVRIVLRKRQ